MSKSFERKEYEPQLQRNIRTRLVNRFREKYRFMGGEEITQFIYYDTPQLAAIGRKPILMSINFPI